MNSDLKYKNVVCLLWIIRVACFTLISTFVTTSEASISLINLSTWKCQPFLRRDAQCATFEVSLSSSVEKILKIQKKIVKRYGNYEKKISWIVKRFEKYRRKLWNDMENMDEMWNDMDNMEEK